MDSSVHCLPCGPGSGEGALTWSQWTSASSGHWEGCTLLVIGSCCLGPPLPWQESWKQEVLPCLQLFAYILRYLCCNQQEKWPFPQDCVKDSLFPGLVLEFCSEYYPNRGCSRSMQPLHAIHTPILRTSTLPKRAERESLCS